jgi:hypothetical protein
VRVDAFIVGATVTEETSPLVTERFTPVAAAAASGGSYDVVEHTTAGENGTRPRYGLSFRGTGVQVYAVLSPTSGRAAVYIDNVLKKTITLTASTTQYQVLVYSSAVLPDRLHTLRIEPVGTSTGAVSAVGLDRIVVVS